ncbi:sensor histidine kinase [Mucilaginibacter limnophilus]|uniref:sensor histidine kinase n=1 Tax=Mucilaginibacter limnophilus TaxID=1932778 RepID=UPI0013E32BDF|nr:sensor histidine kinase [Mucilaginibacter limnophilus]
MKRPQLFLKFKLFAVLAVLFCAAPLFAQKYNFTHYDIEDGLIQSQATMIGQDAQHRLWVGTYGGACRFDGKDYFNLTKATGLNSNLVYAVFTDKQGRLWLGTHKGLSSYDGNKLINFRAPDSVRNKWVMQIVQDKEGNIWTVMDNHLLKIKGLKLQAEKVNGVEDGYVTSLTVHTDGNLYAAVYKKGVYVLTQGKWRPFIRLPDAMPPHITKIAFDRKDSQTVYLLTFKGLYVSKKGIITPVFPKQLGDNLFTCLSFKQDNENNLWIGTSHGVYCIKGGRTLHFIAANGFTDNPVTDIYTDAGGNTWLATMGSGIFKYGGDAFVTYDETNGLKDNQVVMGLARYQNRLILGTEAGLVQLDGNKFSRLTDNNGRTVGRVQCLFTDSKGNLWVGAEAGWKYNAQGFKMIKGTEKHTVIAYAEDEHGTIWIATPSGCFYYENDSLKHVEGSNMFVTSILSLGGDSILLGTQEGVSLVVNKKHVPVYKELSVLRHSSIFGMLKTRNGILFATDDRGVFVWNQLAHKVYNYTERNGLRSNTVYSLVSDNKGMVWIGSGRGMNRMIFKGKSWQVLPDQNEYPVVESNQNAALYYNSRVYIGTAKGLSVYNPNVKQQTSVAPYVMIEDVRSFRDGKAHLLNPSGDSADNRLPADGNHLSISFAGIYLRDARSVTYQYRLVGLEDKFSQPVKNNSVDYPSLPPGKYTFEVRALSPDGAVSKNTATFSFEIVPPFYKTTWFIVLSLWVIIGLVVGAQALWHRQKIQKQKAIEAIKREEKLKIRQQTAEDFHDDLGNKLTRITVLSEMLNVKIEKPEQKQLVEQIRQNAASLYNGTRDILWALDPKSDNLYETLKHIEEIGVELFRDTEITFKHEGVSDEFKQVKLSMEYNRNITMIFKELLNNVLKHADADLVVLKVGKLEKNEVHISLTDDGKGFESKETSRGHGLKNVKTRAGRIGGGLNFVSSPDKGTEVTLKFNITTKTQPA